MAILLVLLFALPILFLRRRPGRLFRSLSLSISLVFEQNKIFLSQLVLLSDCGLNTAFVALLFTDLLIVVRSLVVQRRRRTAAAPSAPARRRPAVSSIPARRRRAVLSDRAWRGTAVPSAPATHLSVGSSSLPVSEVATKPKEEEEMCSFTVIVPQFDCAFGSNRKMVSTKARETMFTCRREQVADIWPYCLQL